MIVQELRVRPLVSVVKISRIRWVGSGERVIKFATFILSGFLTFIPLKAPHEASIGRAVVEKFIPVVSDVFLTAQVLVASLSLSWLVIQVALVLFRLTLNQLVHFLFHFFIEGLFMVATLHFLFKLHLFVLFLCKFKVIVVWHVEPRVL